MGREEDLPLGQEMKTEEEIFHRVNENRRDHYLSRRAPDIWGSGPHDLEHRAFNSDVMLYWRPSQDDSDDFFEQESGDEAPSLSSDDAMGVGD